LSHPSMVWRRWRFTSHWPDPCRGLSKQEVINEAKTKRIAHTTVKNTWDKKNLKLMTPEFGSTNGWNGIQPEIKLIRGLSEGYLGGIFTTNLKIPCFEIDKRLSAKARRSQEICKY
jgi:hypothetical protein